MHLRALLFLTLFAALQSPSGGTIAGRVTFEDSGEPAADLVIRCIARAGSPSERVLTDSDGRYQCKVPAGVYRVRAELSRLDTFYLSQTYGVSQPGGEGRGIRVRANARAKWEGSWRKACRRVSTASSLMSGRYSTNR